MKAIGYLQSHPVSHPESLVDLELPEPTPGPHDLLVRVAAVSVNPVDTKVRRNRAPQGQPEVLGWDAVGIVQALGEAVSGFAVGDRVWYAGAINRPGSNAELQAVDHRIASLAPRSLSDAEAAALPLTAITAWELLFDRLGVPPGKAPTDDRLLIVGAAGGVGSMLTQLAARLTALTVIATASRPESRDWVRELGAHHVIDHAAPLTEGLAGLGLGQVSHVAGLTRSDLHFDAIVEALAPQGRFGLIDDPGEIDIRRLKAKSLSLHWEMMFARPMFETRDMIAQHRLLDEVAALVDAGVLRATDAAHYGAINAANLKRAHALLESGTSRGKVVLEGFSD